jgi:hypothetical protein
MPDGLDPADMIKNDPQAFKTVVGKATHVIEFLLDTLQKNTKDERTYKLRVREEILPLLIAIDNRIDREYFEQKVADAIQSTKEGIHHEVARLEEEKKEARRAPKAQHVVHENDGHAAPMKSNRRENIAEHIRVLLIVLNGERAWVRDAIVKQLKMVMDADELKAFLEVAPEKELQAKAFQFENQIEDIKEKQLLQEISDTLTQYIHLVAREKLSHIRQSLKQAESDGEFDETHKILSHVKALEGLLQTTVSIQKDG